MNRPSCICTHPDAYRCAESRGRQDAHERIPCDCCCHSRDEDGRDGWDDDESGPSWEGLQC